MATKGKRPMRALTPSDKIEAIQRVNDGESKASVARDIGVPESTLRGWCKNEDKLRYMTSRISSPETDKSNDGEPPDKRSRTESPETPSPASSGLDLTAPSTTTATTQLPLPPIDAPVELTTKRTEPSPPPHIPRERRPEPGASVSMSAISPLSGLGHLPGLAHSHFGLSFSDIAANLSLFAQLNPGLSVLSAQPSSLLRSVRSPKPAHNGMLNPRESNHRSKTHNSDPYKPSGSKSSHHGPTASSNNQPIDEAFWYWLKTQQAMLDFTAQTTTAHPLLGKTGDPSLQPKPVAAAAPINSHLDYNRNSWLWQHYKLLGGALPLPDGRHKPAAQVPKEKTAENILYSQLTKGKNQLEKGIVTSPVLSQSRTEQARETADMSRIAEPGVYPEISVENKEPSVERSQDSTRNQRKGLTVLNNLLFNNTCPAVTTKEMRVENVANGEWEAGAAEAMEHGDKFLAWLEASGDPSVTRMQVQQLRSLLNNLRARRTPAAPATSDDQATQRK